MGKLIVIDGLDGSGKATQAKRLLERLNGMHKKVYQVAFPNYLSESSSAVRMYLNGELGKDPSKLNPYMCSAFYAVDRAIQFTQKLMSLYNEDDSIIICDRYLSANIIHQGAKFKSAKDKKEFFDWVYDTEVNKFGLPEDDKTIILSVPVETSQKLMTERYHNHEEKKDIHEANVSYLKKCYNTVDLAVKHLSETGHNWVKIDCSDGNGGIRTREEIEEDIWLVVKDLI